MSHINQLGIPLFIYFIVLSYQLLRLYEDWQLIYNSYRRRVELAFFFIKSNSIRLQQESTQLIDITVTNLSSLVHVGPKYRHSFKLKRL